MAKGNSQSGFVDLKFFLGLIFSIYGAILIATGAYYLLNPISGMESSIDIYWGLLMLVIGAVSFWKSSKPNNWNKAFAISGIERIEKRLKTIEERVEERG